MCGRLKAVAVLALAASGCTNAPVAGFLDNCFPSKARLDAPPAAAADPGPVPSVRPGGSGAPGPKGKSDGPLPPPDFGNP